MRAVKSTVCAELELFALCLIVSGGISLLKHEPCVAKAFSNKTVQLNSWGDNLWPLLLQCWLHVGTVIRELNISFSAIHRLSLSRVMWGYVWWSV